MPSLTSTSYSLAPTKEFQDRSKESVTARQLDEIDSKKCSTPSSIENLARWRRVNGVVESIDSTADFNPSLRKKTYELAAKTISTGKHQSCLMSSPQCYVIVSQPIPGLPDECITACFPHQLSDAGNKATEQRFVLIEEMAASLGTLHKPLNENIYKDKRSENSTEVREPAWADLFRQFGLKIKLQLSKQKSKTKTYVGTIASVIAVGLIPWPFQIACDVVCEPAQRRYVAAPFDARLLHSHVVAGQHVVEGQLLATLDGGELRTEMSGKKAKLAQAEQRQLAALSASDHSKAEFERLEVEHLKREIELLESRQKSLEIRSPITGMVITGDLERAEGVPLAIGDNLFEIASLDRLIAEVAVPEDQVSYVNPKMKVTVDLDAAPGQTHRSVIDRVHLRSEIRDNASVFIAEVGLNNSDSILRPGMNGTAKIHTGHRALAWVLFRRPYNALRHWLGW